MARRRTRVSPKTARVMPSAITAPHACPPATPRAPIPVLVSSSHRDASPRRTPSTNAIGPSAGRYGRPGWQRRSTPSSASTAPSVPTSSWSTRYGDPYVAPQSSTKTRTAHPYGNQENLNCDSSADICSVPRRADDTAIFPAASKCNASRGPGNNPRALELDLPDGPSRGSDKLGNDPLVVATARKQASHRLTAPTKIAGLAHPRGPCRRGMPRRGRLHLAHRTLLRGCGRCQTVSRDRSSRC